MASRISVVLLPRAASGPGQGERGTPGGEIDVIDVMGAALGAYDEGSADVGVTLSPFEIHTILAQSFLTLCHDAACPALASLSEPAVRHTRHQRHQQDKRH